MTFRLHFFADFLQYMAERPEMTSPWHAVALAKAAGRDVKDGQNKENQTKGTNKMKAITMRIQKFSRPGVILMATVVAIIALGLVMKE